MEPAGTLRPGQDAASPRCRAAASFSSEAIAVVSRTANGANGTAPYYSSGGGAGGGIWVTAGSLTGTGTISANGGNGGDSSSGGGAGGRIAVCCCDVQFAPERITVTGGSGWEAGEPGTSFIGSSYIDIVTQPAGDLYFVDESVTLTVEATSTVGPLTYRWRKDGLDLENDTHFSGVYTAALTITGLTADDTGDYDVRLQDDCGPFYSDSAYVLVPPPGDMNCDRRVNAFDIDPFVLALTDPEAYALAYPDCDCMLADINGDGLVNAFDIDPFVQLLTGGG
jgi:hypothetical protein